MTHFIHPDDQFETIGYVDNSGIEHESFEAACRYYGADTPADLAAEDRYWAAEAAIETQDMIEAGGPVFGRFASRRPGVPLVTFSSFDDMPF